MSLQERLERLDPRERRLLGVLGGIVAGFLLLGLPVGLNRWVAAEREENQRLREALDSIDGAQATLDKRAEQRRQLSARYATPAPPLAGYLATVASEHKVEIPESQDRPMVPHGKRYEERSTKLLLRKVPMLNLVKFMEAIAQAPYPLSFSRLDIRKRGSEPDSYDVELIVSAYDRKATEAKAAAGAKASTSPTGSGAL